MKILTPEWLTLHNAGLKLGSDGRTWYVLIGDVPQYALVATPAGGRYGCYIKQTNNGKPIDNKVRSENPDAAIIAGLDELKKYLGW